VSLEISGGKFLEIPSNLSGNLLQIFSLERFRPAWLDKQAWLTYARLEGTTNIQ